MINTRLLELVFELRELRRKEAAELARIGKVRSLREVSTGKKHYQWNSHGEEEGHS